MSDKEERSGVDMLQMHNKLTERDDFMSQEIVDLINTFTYHDTNSLENDDGWKDFKAALWDSLTTGLDDEASSVRDAPVSKSPRTSSAQVCSQVCATGSLVDESLPLGNSSTELSSVYSDSDSTGFVDFSAKQSDLPDLVRLLNKNEIELLDDEESGATRLQFRGKEYILSNGPQEDVDPSVTHVLNDDFDSSALKKNSGRNEDTPPDISEEFEANEGIFKVWDLEIPDEEDELSRQLKALAESTALPTQNQGADLFEERLFVPAVKADGDGYVSTSPSSYNLNTTLNEADVDELVQGVTNLSLKYA